MRSALIVLLAALILAGCASPAAKTETPAAAPRSAASAVASTPPTTEPPRAASAGPTTWREHVEGGQTAYARAGEGVGAAGKVPEFRVPANATSARLLVNWSGQGTGLKLELWRMSTSESTVLWSGALSASPATFDLGAGDLAQLRDVTNADVGPDPGAAASVAFTLDAVFVV